MANNHNTIVSRRKALTAIGGASAVVAGLRLASAKAGATEANPIFGAIENHQRAVAARELACEAWDHRDGSESDLAYETTRKTKFAADWALAQTIPTTAAGLIASLHYLMPWLDGANDDFEMVPPVGCVDPYGDRPDGHDWEGEGFRYWTAVYEEATAAAILRLAAQAKA